MKNSEYKFSAKEEAMFYALGLDDEINFAKKGMTSPFQVYQWAVNKCFLEKIEGPAVDSLRRCYALFGEGKECRLTPEWDALIRLEEDSPSPEITVRQNDDRSLEGWSNIILKEKHT